MTGPWQDLAQAARRLSRRPGFTLLAVLTLGLGLGGATALFSVADAVILRPLPFAEPERLVLFWQNDRTRNQPFVEMSYPAFRDYREQNQVFAELAGMPSTNQGLLLTGRGEPTPLEGRLGHRELLLRRRRAASPGPRRSSPRTTSRARPGSWS